MEQINCFYETNIPQEFRCAPYISFGEYPKGVLYGVKADLYATTITPYDCPKEILEKNQRAVKINGVWYSA